jgi:hypothetical protein
MQIGAQECFLSGVLGFSRITKEAIAETEDARLIGCDDCVKVLSVALKRG